jgi:hypothetical protein
MTDNETNLAKWTAFARATDPEAVGHTLNELAGEIERLRRLVGGTEMCIMNALEGIPKDTLAWTMLNATRKNLANEGSKYGTH